MDEKSISHAEGDGAAARCRCRAYRRRILDMSQKVTAMHVAPAFSCLELVDAAYDGLMRRKPGTARPAVFLDTFLMSKGHGCMSQYVVLEQHAILSRDDLDLYCVSGGRLGAHPDYGVPGIEASTGSLGHGLGMAVGMAHANKLLRDDRVTYVLISDGELHEGSTWEAILMASNLNLGNLVALVDFNNFTAMDRISTEHPATFPVCEKLTAFGWESAEVDGHDHAAIVGAVRARQGKRPFMLVGRTTKGKGVSFMEEVPIWHYRSPSKEEYARAIVEIEQVTR